MNRIFKFRIWDKTEKVMRFLNDTHDTFMFDWDGSMCYYNLQNDSGGDEYEIMQSTGLFDKSGNEIYEGDVVHYVYKPGEGFWNQDCIGIIKWEGTGFKIEPLSGKGGIHSWLVSVPGASEPSCRKLFEIIGNIHENLELLEVQG